MKIKKMKWWNIKKKTFTFVRAKKRKLKKTFACKNIKQKKFS
jgi:hypothetical protein